MTSDLASATATVAGGGGLLKICLIISPRNPLNHTRPPTSSDSASPTMMNQRIIRTGRAGGFAAIARPEIVASFMIFMSCTFCSYLPPRIRRHFAIQMGSNCGFV